jgi:hypothetical protein
MAMVLKIATHNKRRTALCYVGDNGFCDSGVVTYFLHCLEKLDEQDWFANAVICTGICNFVIFIYYYFFFFCKRRRALQLWFRET